MGSGGQRAAPRRGVDEAGAGQSRCRAEAGAGAAGAAEQDRPGAGDPPGRLNPPTAQPWVGRFLFFLIAGMVLIYFLVGLYSHFFPWLWHTFRKFAMKKGVQVLSKRSHKNSFFKAH